MFKTKRSNVAPADSVSPSTDSLFGRTIFRVPLESQARDSQSVDSISIDTSVGDDNSVFTIRLSGVGIRSSTASRIVRKMYAWRGYSVARQGNYQPNQISIVGYSGLQSVATLSIAFDSPSGLKADTLYKPEIDRLRAQGARPCEFTQLAVDGAVKSKRVLVSMIHVGYLYAHRICGFTDQLIEVNPRHVRFYKHMFGYKELGGERHHKGVGAPAVLMHLPCAYVTEKVAQFRGNPSSAASDRSMYSYTFSSNEENRIVERLRELVE